MITPEQAREIALAIEAEKQATVEGLRAGRLDPTTADAVVKALDAVAARILANAVEGQSEVLMVPQDLARRWLLARFDVAWNRIGPFLSRKREEQIKRLRATSARLAALFGQAMGLPVRVGRCQGCEELALVYTPTGRCVEECCDEAANALVAALSGAAPWQGEVGNGG